MSEKRYLVKRGLSWYGDGRAEPGEIRDDLPKKSIPWLLRDGDIEAVEAVTEKPETAEESDGVHGG